MIIKQEFKKANEKGLGIKRRCVSVDRMLGCTAF